MLPKRPSRLEGRVMLDPAPMHSVDCPLYFDDEATSADCRCREREEVSPITRLLHWVAFSHYNHE